MNTNDNLNLTAENATSIKDALLTAAGVKLVGNSVYSLGDKPSIGISVYFNTKEECASGILMNGAHRKFMLHHDGSLVELTGYKTNRFRKCKVKSVKAAITKLTKWAESALTLA